MSLTPRTSAPGKARRAASVGKPKRAKKAAFKAADPKARHTTAQKNARKSAATTSKTGKPASTRRYSDVDSSTQSKKQERLTDRSKLRAKRFQEKTASKPRPIEAPEERAARIEQSQRPESRAKKFVAQRDDRTKRAFDKKKEFVKPENKKSEYKKPEFRKSEYKASDTRPTNRRDAAKAKVSRNDDGRPNFVPQKRTKWIPGQKPRKPETERPDTTRANRTERAFKPRSTTDSRTVNKSYSGKKSSTAYPRTHTREAIDFGANDTFKVFGRGELHISILLENMRREGYELQVSQPQVIIKEVDGKKTEPFEELTVDVRTEHAGAVIEKIGRRKGIMTDMREREGISRIIFEIPTRGLLGYRGQFVIDTKGEGIMSSRVVGFREYVGEINKHETGSMISMESGKALAFALWNLQERGVLYIKPTDEIYTGMVVGNVTKGDEMTVNPTKGKQLTNMRASGSDESIYLTPAWELTIERGLEIMHEDEYLEICPKSVRLRKKFLTDTDRAKAKR